MIVAVKRGRKQKLIKLISLLAVLAMFGGYYWHMSNEFDKQQKQQLEEKQAALAKQKELETQKDETQKAIMSEIKKAVALVGQENVRHVKIIENKLILICELETNIEPLMVRYGTMALTKKTLNEIIIAVDIKYVLESKLNG
ncbi:MAG: hypothetical protein ACQERD_06680 [Campylobacterota bacterium]